MEIKYLIIHHSAISRTKKSEQFDAINNYHKNKGWGMIGYHYLIEPSGELKKGREETTIGAHCYGHNHDSLGICLAGNFDIEYPTREQEISLSKLLETLQEKYPKAEIKHHRDFRNTHCPGKLLGGEWHKPINNKKMTPILTKDKDDHQYITFDEVKFSCSIPDPKMLPDIKKHFKFTDEPVYRDLTGYYIYRGSTAFFIKEFFNL